MNNVNVKIAIPFSSDFSDYTPVITAYLSSKGYYSTPNCEVKVGSGYENAIT
jgi:hypothetical protein